MYNVKLILLAPADYMYSNFFKECHGGGLLETGDLLLKGRAKMTQDVDPVNIKIGKKKSSKSDKTTDMLK